MRKKVIALALALIAGGTIHAQNTGQKKEVKAYMVSNAHLDTQWNWDIQTTIKEYVWNTISQNLFLLKRYPEYIFNFEGGVKYAWMKEYYPEQYEEMKKFIKEGRWHISGSSWEANDALVPSTESAIRNILLGQTYYRQEFGAEGTDIFLPDCFGFGWTLPTIASHCGLIGFSSQKLDWRNRPFYSNKSKHPFTIGLWKGVDGSSIMLAHGYDYVKRWDNQDLSKNKELKELADRDPLKTVNRYYGTGDIGGSPTLESVNSIVRGITGEGPIEIISATSDQLFKDYLPYKNHPELPVFDGELLMDVHGTGCYTSQAAMKLYNRQNEQLGDAAERAAVAAEWLGAAAYPSNALTEAWQRFIFHQFHDDLTGTSIPRAYEFSWNDELISLKQFSSTLSSSVNAVAGLMDTRVKGTPVILYNALAFPVSDVAEIILEMPKAPKGFTVYDTKGKKVASQLISYEKGKARLLIAATVPAAGYAVYDVCTAGTEKTVTPTATTTLENSVYKITLDKNGDITSLQDKKNRKELVNEGKAIRLALFTENKSYDWPGWEIMKEVVDRTPVSITDNVKITMIENGDVRKALCIEKQHGKSVFKQYIRLYEGSRADRIDFYNEIDWHSTNALLKAEFPLNIANQKATYDLGIGSIERGNNTPTAYEVYAQQWADLTDKGGDYGVSVLNDSKYGWDKPDDSTIRLTLLHTPSTRNFDYQDQQDLGFHTFTYSLVGHAGTLDKTSTVIKAEVLNQPLKAFSSTKHAGALGKEFTFARSENDNVLIKALKKAEVSDEYVVRVYETEGKNAQSAAITFAGEIESACEADGTEKRIGNATFDGNKLQVSIDPYHVKTFKVKLKKSGSSVTPMQHAYLPLEYDRKCISWNEFRREADFEAGNSYAAELLPDSMVVNGIPFRLGEKEFKNGLACNGNVIQLPAGHHYNRLYFLAASTTQDCTAIFTAANNQQEITVPCYTGFIGQWAHTGHTEGFLKNAEIAHVGTHRHSPEGDEAYEFTYMFKFGIDIPKGATTITLPKDSRIVVFATTLVRENQPSVSIASELFRTALKSAEQTLPSTKKNLLDPSKIIGCSGAVNDQETAKFALDNNADTKWCDVNKAPNFIDFDLGSSQAVNGWKLVNAGNESGSYITRSCFLQGRNQANEEWKTIDQVDGNRKNTVVRQLSKPASVRYIRLLVTQPTQDNSGNTTRICEFEVY